MRPHDAERQSSWVAYEKKSSADMRVWRVISNVNVMYITVI